MPQQATSQSNGQDQNADPISFIYQHRKRLNNMDPDKAVKFVGRMFERYALPKYQQINKQKPLDEEELERLRLQFAARMFDIPYEQETKLKDPAVKYGAVAKAGATAASAGAGVIGGLRSIEELREKVQKHLGPIGKILQYDPVNMLLKKGMGPFGEIEKKAYEESKLVSPKGAERGAAVGHQIPSAIAAGGAGKVLPTLAKGAPLGLRVMEGAARGGMEASAFEGARPGGDIESGAKWGMALGAAFPMLGKLFGLGKNKAVSAGVEAAKPAAEAVKTESKSLGDVFEKTAKDKFGKPFKDLSPSERSQMSGFVKEEIKKQQVQKAATAKATKAATKAEAEAGAAAKRAEKASAATAKAAQQAAKRGEVGTTPAAKQAVAAKAAEENPDAAKIMAGFKPGEGTAAAAPGQTIKTNIDQELESAKHELGKAKDILKNPNATAEEKKIAKDNYRFWKEKLEKPGITKVPEGQSGPKVRAKEGQPASPAQQAADRERISKVREESKREEFGSALEKKAQELAGKYTSATQVGIQQIPELESAVKEIEGGDVVLGGLQKLRRSKKITDEIYADSLKEWIMNQFGAQP